MSFQLPDLPYDFGSLEPHIDAKTMEIHHDKHHGGYTKKLNSAIEGTPADDQSIEEILKNLDKNNTPVRNNGGGFHNHSMFWKWMSPNGGGKPSGDIASAIDSDFGSFDDFREKFTAAAKGRFGSGWAWLVVDGGKLKIGSTPNQDSPLMPHTELNGTPVLGIDVWEHAYYLNYQNRRPDYIEAWYNVVNWDQVSEDFNKAR